MQHPDDITQHPSDMLDVMQAAPEAGSMEEESLSGLPLHQVDTLVTEEANITAGHAEAGTGRLWEDRPLRSDMPTPQHAQTHPPHSKLKHAHPTARLDTPTPQHVWTRPPHSMFGHAHPTC